MHAVTGVGRPQVCQSCASQQDPCAVRVIHGRQDPLALQGVREIDLFAITLYIQQLGQGSVGRDGLVGECIDGRRTTDAAGDGPGCGGSNDAVTVIAEQLKQSQ